MVIMPSIAVYADCRQGMSRQLRLRPHTRVGIVSHTPAVAPLGMPSARRPAAAAALLNQVPQHTPGSLQEQSEAWQTGPGLWCP